MLKLDENKLATLRRFDDVLNEKYGSEKSVERKDFDAKAKAWYYAELLKDERKRQNITQKSLAEKIGKKREYISALEKGQTDMQLSTFLKIADALGLRFSLVLGWVMVLRLPHSCPDVSFSVSSIPQLFHLTLLYNQKEQVEKPQYKNGVLIFVCQIWAN